MFNNLKIAFSFLTVFPIPVETDGKKGSLSQAMIFFPLVGLIIGMISLMLTNWIDAILSERLTNLLLVFIPILLSGGLHIDGLADSFDAFFQRKSKEDILRVMKDSRIGVWGALSILFLILIKWEFIMIIPHKSMSYLFALAASRWSHVVLCYLLPYARKEDGLGKKVAGQIEDKQLMLSTVFMIVLSFLLGIKGIAILLICWAFIYLLSNFYKRKIDGITGDVIGATGELTEVFIYILIVLFYGPSIL